MSNPTIAKASDTYRKIATRLSGFSPPILIEQHIASDLFAGRTTLDGVNFVAKDYDRLLAALRNAKDLSGEKAFAEGSMHDPRHWALRLSFTATHGIGFREIWRPRLSDRLSVSLTHGPARTPLNGTLVLALILGIPCSCRISLRSIAVFQGRPATFTSTRWDSS